MGMLDKIRDEPANAAKPTTALDPVCGMTIDPARAAGTSGWNGQTVHFCSAGCKARFDRSPEAYAGKLRA